MNKYDKFFIRYYKLAKQGCIFVYRQKRKLTIIKTEYMTDLEIIFVCDKIANYLCKKKTI